MTDKWDDVAFDRSAKSDLSYHFPERSADVLPLIDAAEAYPAMEEALLDCREFAYLSFRILDPATQLRSERALAERLITWGDLLVHTALRGVKVRLLISDFDPIVANSLHCMAWRNMRMLWQQWNDQDHRSENLQVILALHEGTVGAIPRYALWPFVRRRLSRLLKDLPDPDCAPGILPFLDTGGKRHRAVLLPPALNWPATHHQKSMVVDDRTAFVGGLDINERRFDDSDHDKTSSDTWHDISLRIDGPLATDVSHFFRDLWNHEVGRYTASATGTNAPPTVHRFPQEPHPLTDEPPASNARASDGVGSLPNKVRLIKTQSRKSPSPFAVTPTNESKEIAEAHLAAIDAARDFIYIENQYFRLKSYADALVRRMTDCPELQVIILLPMAPEDVAFDGNRGADARYGEYLQIDALDRLRDAGEDRFGVFSLVRKRPATHGEEGRAKAYGSGIIYLHSKVLIVDDRRAIVGSANINGRSFYMDTELAVDWTGSEGVSEFRKRLWASHFKTDIVRNDRASLSMWQTLANTNAKLEPSERIGFIVPYEIERARRLARFERFIPVDYV